MRDVIIIGGGPAGLAAGIYAARSGLKAALIEKQFVGGQAATAGEVENYPGMDSAVLGMELSMKMEAQAKNMGLEIIYDEVLSLEMEGKTKKVTASGGSHEAGALIIATGGAPRELGLPNERALRGRGVSYCATCDGAFFGGKPVAVVGGGNVAVEDALFLSRYTEKVYLIHRRDVFRADKIFHAKIFENEKIETLMNSEVTALLEENGVLTGIDVTNNKSGQTKRVSVSGIFIAIGSKPQNGLCEGLAMNENGYVVTDEEMRTNIEGVFAAGDIREKPLRQIVTAAADGAVAAVAAAKYLLG